MFIRTQRLPLLLLAPAFIGVVTAIVLLGWLLPGPIVSLTADRLLAELRVLSQLLPQEDGADLQAWVRALPAGTDLRVTLIGTRGDVLAESALAGEDMEMMDNHADRPEVIRALREGEGWSRRRSGTTGVTYVYAARAFTDRSGRQRVLRLARPVAALGPIHRSILISLAPAFLITFLALYLASRRLDRHLIRPLIEVIRGTDQLAEGDLAHRLPTPDNDLLRLQALAVHRLAARASGEISTLSAERDHLRRILDRMSEGVMVVGADGKALLVNPAFFELFGIPERDVRGSAPLELIRQPGLARLIESTLGNGRSATEEVEVAHPESRSLAVTSASLGSAAGAVLVARDTTDSARLARMRQDFVANVSHELKTPLAAIRGYAETLADGALEDPDAARRFVGRIEAQCRRLQAIVEDLLTLSQLESRGGDPTDLFAPLALPPLIERSVHWVAPSAREHEVEIQTRDLEPLEVLGNAVGLERLIVNLLDNAVKYNRPGGTVQVRLRGVGEEVILEIEDTGIGISPEAQPRIFERFYRVDKGRSRVEGGTGLGLAIVKHIAHTHKGRVEVESREGKGSIFRVALPRPGTPASR